MTDSEKLDLLLEKATALDSMLEKAATIDLLLEKVTGLEKDMADVKADLKRLHQDDNFIIDEIERVHAILDRHKADKTAHTA